MPATSRPQEAAPADDVIGPSARLPKAVLLLSHGIGRELLRHFIDRLSCVEVVGAAGDYLPALDVCRQTQPGVIVMDWCISSGTQPSLASILRRELPAARILVLHAVSAEILRETLRCGITGFVDQNESLEVLDRGIRAVSSGRQFFCRSATNLLRRLMIDRRPNSEPPELSSRELLVLKGIAKGRFSKEVASELSLSVFTIENIRRRLMKKTGLRSVAELTLHAVKLGLIPPPQLRPAAMGP